MPGEKTNLIARLNRIGVALSSQTDLDKLFQLIVTSARESTSADGGSLYILERDRLNFVVAQNETLSRRPGWVDPFKPHPLPLSSRSIAGYVASTGRVVNIADVYCIPPDAPFGFDKSYDQQNGYRTRSTLCVPMHDTEGKVVGVVQLVNRMSREGDVLPFTESDEELLLSLASQAAVAYLNARLLRQFKDLLDAVVEYSVTAIESRSPVTAGHTRRLVRYCMALAEAVNRETEGRLKDVKFTPDQLEEIRFAAWLHDIGKISVPESVLDKAAKLAPSVIESVKYRFRFAEQELEAERDRKLGQAPPQERQTIATEYERALHELRDGLQLVIAANTKLVMSDEEIERIRALAVREFTTPEGERRPLLSPDELEHLCVKRGNLSPREWQIMQDHVVQTAAIVKKLPFPEKLRNVAEIAASHHEKMDGSGYPRGLKGDEILPGARILAVADVFEALVAEDRPYKPRKSIAEALAILQGLARKNQLDPDFVELFVRRRVYEWNPAEATHPGKQAGSDGDGLTTANVSR